MAKQPLVAGPSPEHPSSSLRALCSPFLATLAHLDAHAVCIIFAQNDFGDVLFTCTTTQESSLGTDEGAADDTRDGAGDDLPVGCSSPTLVWPSLSPLAPSIPGACSGESGVPGAGAAAGARAGDLLRDRGAPPPGPREASPVTGGAPMRPESSEAAARFANKRW